MLDRVYYKSEHAAIYDWYREKYADRNSYLITDGIVDLENYEGIVFLLKEAYIREQKRDEWDLSKGLAEKSTWGMWRHVAKWVYGLINTDAKSTAAFCDLSEEDRKALIRKIAIMNVKKVDGVPTSDDKDLSEHVNRNSEMLRRELAIMQPRIIVCGGSFKFLKELYSIKIKSHCDNWYYWLDLGEMKNVLVLDYFHPAVRYPELLTYYGLASIYQQALLHHE